MSYISRVNERQKPKKMLIIIRQKHASWCVLQWSFVHIFGFAKSYAEQKKSKQMKRLQTTVFILLQL